MTHAIPKWLSTAIGITAVIVAGLVFMLSRAGGETIAVQKGETEEKVVSEAPREGNVLAGTDRVEGVLVVDCSPTVCVHVCGQVVEEGVFFVVKGARIADAVDAAGGFTDDAAVRALNLAMPVTDGMQIYVPTVEEAETGRYRPPNAEVGEAVRLVNINTADAATLMTLPGIGEQKAKDIVAYRSAHGKFAEASDIMNVSGIKSAVFERIKDQICTE